MHTHTASGHAHTQSFRTRTRSRTRTRTRTRTRSHTHAHSFRTRTRAQLPQLVAYLLLSFDRRTSVGDTHGGRRSKRRSGRGRRDRVRTSGGSRRSSTISSCFAASSNTRSLTLKLLRLVVHLVPHDRALRDVRIGAQQRVEDR